ncbi:uncharacterized protein LOC126778822 [Nymphalis io]|uniref:uncharacterized protein LOC126778822 n=1 Tax=Inachis io TaxID=171585 RepID=UPI00216770A6|nr:uncharacterized protein LOC126778822 [Nymphalis io]XP_050358480.1 uncharacterized protein LOC126778822 [Nymphalis io]XP_050358481.1 uncharacterized protein LOC126778822 [Nymphalis io]
MASVEERLNKLREDRVAREKARIEKLRELNLKKYGKNDFHLPKNSSTVSLPVKSKSDTSGVTKSTVNHVKNNIQLNGLKRPTSIPTLKKLPPKDPNNGKNVQSNNTKAYSKISNQANNNIGKDKMTNGSKVDTKCPKAVNINGKDVKIDKPLKEITPEVNIKHFNEICHKNPKITITEVKDINKSVNNKANPKNDLKSRKSLAVSKIDNKSRNFNKRKSMQPSQMANGNGKRESVFDRLYKPKMVAPKQTIDNALKLRTDPDYLKKVINDSRLIMNKRHTVFETKPSMPVRRSISAVHLKKISRKELGNCFHKWASIGEKIDKVHLKDVNEDDCIKSEKVISAVKSERKKVKFQTPVPYNFNTPKPEELQSKLRNWLKKRGKAIDSYHHLQCFGLHNLSRDIRPLNIDTPKFEEYDDEDKENIALDHDSDNESYLENMNNQNGEVNEEVKNEIGFPTEKWRRASNISDSVDFNESYETTLTSGDVMHHVDELLLGALNDLTELLREGFDWEQCARWLRAIRDRFPSAPDNAPYWECRAALEERRGDLPASVQCWEQAIAKGTEQSVVEANLDQLLDKFMQLKISPSSGRRQVDPKLVDVKNIFKSTIIRFAVQQAKLRQSNEPPKYTVTPVRRSSRLSSHWRQTPLRVCTTIHQASELGADFKPNKALTESP